MLLKLSWLPLDILADVLGEIPGQFDRRSSRSWPFHLDLALGFSDDLVPAPAQETDVLKSSESEMRMDGPALLAFQHGHIGHRIADP
jgi:hypothetical protein